MLGLLLALEEQRGHLFPWVPVCMGAGIGVYFALPAEPGGATLWALGLAIGAGVVLLARWARHSIALLAAVLVLLGVVLAAFRTHDVAAPVLGFRYYGPIEGRIVAIDRSASDKERLTLDQVVLYRVAPERTPGRVRVSLHGDQGHIEAVPGLRVILTGHLDAPGGPVEPGGFDFQRQAWFQGIGAVGYTRTPALALAPAEEGRAGLLIHRIRMAISRHVQEAMPGRAGAFAAAITTGDRSGMDAVTLENLRASNLAHLLAISGLHMGLLTAFVFSAVRYGLALVPYIALRWPLKKIGAVIALAAGAVYLALSGGNVATERAFIMVSVMLLAVLFDRRALTIRAVALAAVIVMVMRPEQVMGPGFQMSFAATVALISVFGALRDHDGWRAPKWLRPLIALLISSGVAGAATAPIAAVHFNQIPHYGLLANTLSVPLMGSIIIPGAVLAALLAPLGLAFIGFAVMRPAIDWILWVADWVAGMSGALSFVPAPPGAVLPLVTLGALWVVLWRGRWMRAAGLAPGVLALALWAGADRPDLLVSQTGGLVGVMTPSGRAMSKERGEGFAALNWLENDGDPADQPAAAARAGFGGEAGRQTFTLAGYRGVHLSGRGAAEQVTQACADADLVILAGEATAPEGCLLIDRDDLALSGAMAIRVRPDGLEFVTSRGRAGARPWNTQ